MKMVESATIYMIVFIMLFNFCMIRSIFLSFLIFCQKGYHISRFITSQNQTKFSLFRQ